MAHGYECRFMCFTYLNSFFIIKSNLRSDQVGLWREYRCIRSQCVHGSWGWPPFCSHSTALAFFNRV